MTVALVNNRRTVRYRLRDLLRSALPGVQVEIGWPGDDVEWPSIWLGKMTGPKEVIALGAPRRIYNDNFTVTLLVHALGDDLEAAEAQMDLQVNALEELLTTNPDLDGIPGVMDTGVNIDIDEFDPLPTNAGLILVCEITVPFFCRIQ